MMALLVLIGVTSIPMLALALWIEVRMYRDVASYHRALEERRRQADADARRYVDAEAMR